MHKTVSISASPSTVPVFKFFLPNANKYPQSDILQSFLLAHSCITPLLKNLNFTPPNIYSIRHKEGNDAHENVYF